MVFGAGSPSPTKKESTEREKFLAPHLLYTHKQSKFDIK